MKRAAIYLALSVVLAVAPIYGARPLSTDDAGTVERGMFETELSLDFCQHRPDGTSQTPGISVKHGLTGRMDLGLGFSHGTDKDADGNTVGWGMSPLEFGFKMALLKEHQTLPDISLSAGCETGGGEYGLNLILSREYGDFGLHCNLGYNSPGEAMVKGIIGTSIAAEYTFAGRYRICAELHSEVLDDRDEVIGNSGQIGGSMDFGPLNWDLGARIHDQRGPKTTITTGITAGF